MRLEALRVIGDDSARSRIVLPPEENRRTERQQAPIRE